MNPHLRSCLLSLNDVDFRELELNIQTARLCSNIIAESGKDLKWFSRQLGVPLMIAKEFISGAYQFSLRDLAMIQTIDEEVQIEKAKKRAAEKIKVGKDAQ